MTDFIRARLRLIEETSGRHNKAKLCEKLYAVILDNTWFFQDNERFRKIVVRKARELVATEYEYFGPRSAVREMASLCCAQTLQGNICSRIRISGAKFCNQHAIRVEYIKHRILETHMIPDLCKLVCEWLVYPEHWHIG